MSGPESAEDIKKRKASISSFQDPDSGTAGRRFPIISEGIVENLVPGVTGRFNLFTHSQQGALDSYEPKRIDDGVSGTFRTARVIYYEDKPLQDVEHQNVIAELIALEPDDEPASSIPDVRVVYCATAGGATAANIVPDSVMGDSADLTRIMRYPKFYTLVKDGAPEPVLNGLCRVEYTDLEQYDFGIYRGMMGETDESGLVATPGADRDTAAAAATNPEGAKSTFVGPVPSLNINRGDFPNANAHRRAKFKAAGDYLVPEDIIRANPPSNSDQSFIGIAGMNSHGMRLKTLYHEIVMSDFDPAAGVTEEQFFGAPRRKYKGKYRGVKGGIGNIKRVYLRKDAMVYLKKAIKEIHARGGYFVSAGGCSGIQRPSRTLHADQHRLGTAFDLSLGCAGDRRGWVKTGGSPKGTPRYIHVRIGPHSRRHKVMCRVDDDHPAASQTPVGKHLHQIVKWGRSATTVEVVGRYFDLTELFARHGFTSIGGYRSFYYRNGKDQGGWEPGHVVLHPRSGEHEWWHFQFCSQFIYGKTNYLSELARGYKMEAIQKYYDKGSYAKISRKQGWIYGSNWG